MELAPTLLVALTTFEAERPAILVAGCDQFICKPFQAEYLLNTLQSYLGPQSGQVTGPAPAHPSSQKADSRNNPGDAPQLDSITPSSDPVGQ